MGLAARLRPELRIHWSTQALHRPVRRSQLVGHGTGIDRRSETKGVGIKNGRKRERWKGKYRGVASAGQRV